LSGRGRGVPRRGGSSPKDPPKKHVWPASVSIWKENNSLWEVTGWRPQRPDWRQCRKNRPPWEKTRAGTHDRAGGGRHVYPWSTRANWKGAKAARSFMIFECVPTNLFSWAAGETNRERAGGRGGLKPGRHANLVACGTFPRSPGILHGANTAIKLHHARLEGAHTILFPPTERGEQAIVIKRRWRWRGDFGVAAGQRQSLQCEGPPITIFRGAIHIPQYRGSPSGRTQSGSGSTGLTVTHSVEKRQFGAFHQTMRGRAIFIFRPPPPTPTLFHVGARTIRARLTGWSGALGKKMTTRPASKFPPTLLLYRPAALYGGGQWWPPIMAQFSPRRHRCGDLWRPRWQTRPIAHRRRRTQVSGAQGLEASGPVAIDFTNKLYDQNFLDKRLRKAGWLDDNGPHHGATWMLNSGPSQPYVQNQARSGRSGYWIRKHLYNAPSGSSRLNIRVRARRRVFSEQYKF